MVRQAINCDICGTERVESTSLWFVAQEEGGEIRLRGWEAPRKSRKAIKHLCGQKCVQRLMDNFTAALVAGKSAVKDSAHPAAIAPAAEGPAPVPVPAASPISSPTLVQPPAPAPVPLPSPAPPPLAAQSTIRLDSMHVLANAHEEMSILERMGYDRETVALIEADSWAGPVRIKDEAHSKDEPAEFRAPEFRKEEFLPAIDSRPKPEREFTGLRIRHFQRMA